MSERRWFCPCGYSVSDAHGRDAKRDALTRHHESGEHARMTKVNALRAGMAAVDAAFEHEIARVEEEMSA